MDFARVLADLSRNRAAIQDVQVPRGPGVYAIFLATPGALPGVGEGADGLLYIGISANLAQREFDTHFQAGKSGFSTLRRTLGALLRDTLALTPRPRGSGTSDINYRNYRFDDAGEDRLSAWMREHLQVGVRPLSYPGDVERELVRHGQPPLNLTLWANPGAVAIKAARKACVDAARAVT